MSRSSGKHVLHLQQNGHTVQYFSSFFLLKSSQNFGSQEKVHGYELFNLLLHPFVKCNYIRLNI